MGPQVGGVLERTLYRRSFEPWVGTVGGLPTIQPLGFGGLAIQRTWYGGLAGLALAAGNENAGGLGPPQLGKQFQSDSSSGGLGVGMSSYNFAGIENPADLGQIILTIRSGARIWRCWALSSATAELGKL